MENIKTKEWQQAVDSAEEVSLIRDLPMEYPLGGRYVEEVANGPSRVWKRLEIVSAKTGARWCYWHPWWTVNPHSGAKMAGLGPNPEHQVIADTIFNGDAPHFVGMLGIPSTGTFPGSRTQAWVLISPRFLPPPEERIIEEKPKERYERSKEIYDVETHTSTRLPGRS